MIDGGTAAFSVLAGLGRGASRRNCRLADEACAYGVEHLGAANARGKRHDGGFGGAGAHKLTEVMNLPVEIVHLIGEVDGMRVLAFYADLGVNGAMQVIDDDGALGAGARRCRMP